ncbi:hypothetical protein TSUD_422970 [Trifolium subterraneum]|uniref:ABC transporter domain-containing protein n=1 Tax=Trifolium subterraneum TaxID=3900 RepID=A0A1B5Z915_TRISU|nr:hypothetical protein TSUD_422970 [Trifolium subterraneum]
MTVLGASGSDKSTLIDALADIISKESLKGTVTLNDDVLESSLQKVISAYVMQDDVLFPMLTVEETLMFSAEFRLPRSLKIEEKARVQALINQLGRRNYHRRRRSLRYEPTSGLDSTSAYMLVKGFNELLRAVASL